MASKRYTLVLADGFEDTFAKKDSAIRAGEKTGQDFQVLSPAGNPVHTHNTPGQEDSFPEPPATDESAQTEAEYDNWEQDQAASDLLDDLIGEEADAVEEEIHATLDEDIEEEPVAADAEEVLSSETPKQRKPQDIGKLKAKIAKMLEKAESTTFPAEAEAFTEAAEKLMLRLGITIAELESQGKVEIEEIVEVNRVYRGNYSISYLPYIASVAGGFGDITILQQKTGGLDRIAYIIGQKSDVEQFTRLMDSLDQQVVTGLRAWQKANIEKRRGLTDMQKFLQHRSFIEGFGSRVGQRLKALRTEETAEVSTGAALVLASKESRNAAWIQEQYGEMKADKTKRSHSSIGYFAGDHAGKTATIGQTEVSGKSGEISK